MKSLTGCEFAAFIGIDWADAKHDICLQVANTGKREFAVLPHRWRNTAAPSPRVMPRTTPPTTGSRACVHQRKHR